MDNMEETANVILTKLKLMDPTLSPFSAYQQSAEIRQLWSSIESSIKTILSVTSTTISTDPIDASSQIITVLSASTLLSSIIHAIISTQRRINKSNEHIETVIKKETEVILYHIQILKQDINQSHINVESAQEAIIYHTNILVDSLVAYSLTSCNTYPIHPYRVSPSISTSISHRHSQPCIRQSLSQEELLKPSLDSREKSVNTVGKKFMQSINSLKQRPAFNKTLLPNRHSVEPTNSEQPPNKKRIFFSKQMDESDEESTLRKGGNATLRFIFNGGWQQKSPSPISAKKTSSAMKHVSKELSSELGTHGKKKRESISTFFHHNKKETKKQDSFYSTFTISSSESIDKDLEVSPKVEDIPHLISPSSKKLNIHWTTPEKNGWRNATELYSVQSIHTGEDADEEEDSESACNPIPTSLQHEKSRKRRSNGSFMPTTKESPLPPVPTVENFLAIMDASLSPPQSPYFSAQSSTSTLNSVLLDDVTDSLASAHIMEPCLSSESNTSSTDTGSDEDDLFIPPPVPPKDLDLVLSIDNKSIKRASSAEMRVSTHDLPRSITPKSADISKSRHFIPPRRSSMPSTIEPEVAPPLPLNAKKITDAFNDKKGNLKTTSDESSWGMFFKREESNDVAKRAKLRRSLGAVPRKIKKSEGVNQLLKVTEHGQVVLLYEMIRGKFQVMAGTPERLFEKLADETTQDMYFVDTYITYHSHFTTSDNFLNQLICRFHLGPSPGEYEYFKKWQHSIQQKVLNVIDRWITIQYQDFKQDMALQKKLNMFLFNNDIVHLHHFKHHIDKIQQNLRHQITFNPNHIVSMKSFVNHFPVHSPRRPSNGLFNLAAATATTTTITDPITLHTSLVSIESKEIARYLTLADYYLFKAILSDGSLNNKATNKDTSYIDLMTKRANSLSQWVVYEICSISYLKPKRSLVKKFIEIAKLCLEMSNFHTCMVITMGLSSAPKLTEVWESLSSRDMNTFTSLQKLLDVSMNMRYYRHKIQLAKSPCVPFLPVILKDQTFFNENAIHLVSHPNLINFAKFTLIRQFVDKLKEMTNENYWFSNDLTYYPFLPQTTTIATSLLDTVADWVEHRFTNVPEDCRILLQN